MDDRNSIARNVARQFFQNRGYDYGPHVFMVYGLEDALFVLMNWGTLHAHGVDTLVVWDDNYTKTATPVKVDGKWTHEFNNPNTVPILKGIQNMGVKLLQYIAPSYWLGAGARLYDIFDELDRHGWADGVAMDGTWMVQPSRGACSTLCEIEDFMGILSDRMRGPHFLHHSVPDPFEAPETQGGTPLHFQPSAVTSYFDWVMWGETNTSWPTSLDDPLWRYHISGAHRGHIGIYKPREVPENPWNAKKPENTDWIVKAPERLITYRCTRKRWEPKNEYAHWPNWRELFYKSWKQQQVAYLADPDGWVNARF